MIGVGNESARAKSAAHETAIIASMDLVFMLFSRDG
jgi:hypothetical protein